MASLPSKASEAQRSNFLPVVFSCLGHLYIHLCTAFYFVIVLSVEEDWQLPYPELLELWTLGALLVGLAALPAGLLSDRIGPSAMMVLFFVGMGGASIAAGFAPAPPSLFVALAGVGLFAAIYHPVGIPWLVRSASTSRGKLLGINGVFGALGSALAGLAAAALIEHSGWRAAFIVPGILCALTGVVLFAFWATGRLGESAPRSSAATAVSVSDSRRAFGILLVTMFTGGLIFHSTQTSLPKLFELQSDGLAGEGALGVGLLVAIVYGVSGLMQVLGGHLADRLPLKPVYVGSIAIQIPTLWLASKLGGLPLLLVATTMVIGGASALPAENLLLARYTPEKHHGVAFGLKFALSFGAAPLAVGLVAYTTRRTGELSLIYVLLAFVALTTFLFAMFLPCENKLSATP